MVIKDKINIPLKKPRDLKMDSEYFNMKASNKKKGLIKNSWLTKRNYEVII